MPKSRYSAVIYVWLNPHKVGMFRFLLEAWDNLALATTLERDTAIVKVIYAEESRATVLAALEDMQRTLAFTWRELQQPLEKNKQNSGSGD